MKSFRLLRANEIECRVSTVKGGDKKGVSLLLYKDARCDQNILDETVGPDRWQRKHELIDGKLFCSVGIRYERGNGVAEWVWKQDVGTESYTEKEKGQASDAFKRACFNWGLGRELYSAPFIWVRDANVVPKGNGYTCYDTFAVKSIDYDENEAISHLEIVNAKTGKLVYRFGNAGKKAEKQAKTEQAGYEDGQDVQNDRPITQDERQTIMKAIAGRFEDNEKRNAAYKEVIARLGLRSMMNMTFSQIDKAYEILNGIQ